MHNPWCGFTCEYSRLEAIGLPIAVVGSVDVHLALKSKWRLTILAQRLYLPTNLQLALDFNTSAEARLVAPIQYFPAKVLVLAGGSSNSSFSSIFEHSRSQRKVLFRANRLWRVRIYIKSVLISWSISRWMYSLVGADPPAGLLSPSIKVGNIVQQDTFNREPWIFSTVLRTFEISFTPRSCRVHFGLRCWPIESFSPLPLYTVWRRNSVGSPQLDKMSWSAPSPHTNSNSVSKSWAFLRSLALHRAGNR